MLLKKIVGMINKNVSIDVVVDWYPLYSILNLMFSKLKQNIPTKFAARFIIRVRICFEWTVVSYNVYHYIAV